ncbi:MAG TPA: DNA repair protein RadC [Prolixibacteraceae bacterium]|nr:DNA repair protein RadC [Prolixibacteraceae bacterium]
MESYKKLNLKEWAVEDRPREKMLSRGPRALSDAELIAILIGSGSAEETAVELSRRILHAVDNDLDDLGRRNSDFLTRFKGIGEAKAINILAAMELGRRRREITLPGKPAITGSHEAAALMTPLLGDLNHEEFWILLLNRSNRVLDKYMVSKGGITGTVIDVRTIMKCAVEKSATSMILCHNHPSGNLSPSDADLQITRKIKDAGQLMEIQVLDHLIITQKSHFSFADNGLL